MIIFSVLKKMFLVLTKHGTRSDRKKKRNKHEGGGMTVKKKERRGEQQNQDMKEDSRQATDKDW